MQLASVASIDSGHAKERSGIYLGDVRFVHAPLIVNRMALCYSNPQRSAGHLRQH